MQLDGSSCTSDGKKAQLEGFGASVEGGIQQDPTPSSTGRPCCMLVIQPDGNGNHDPMARVLRRRLACAIPEADKQTWYQDRRFWVLLPDTDLSAARSAADQVCGLAGGGLTYEIYASGPDPAGRQFGWIRVWPDPQAARPRGSLATRSRRPMPLWKRTMDILGAVIGLAIASPILLMAAAIIRSGSKGPVLFRQQRVGLNGQRFTMFKLRTYHVCARQQDDHKQHVWRLIQNGHTSNGSPWSKMDDHPGIIPLGRFIRKTCIDELPQLINVLKGQMSLVGPRPAMPYEVEMYSPWHFQRLEVVPGMTGLWQVSGKNHLTFDQMVSLDIQYARRLSPWLDLWILFKTPLAVLQQIRDALIGGARRPAQVQPHVAVAPASS